MNEIYEHKNMQNIHMLRFHKNSLMGYMICMLYIHVFKAFWMKNMKVFLLLAIFTLFVEFQGLPNLNLACLDCEHLSPANQIFEASDEFRFLTRRKRTNA